MRITVWTMAVGCMIAGSVICAEGKSSRAEAQAAAESPAGAEADAAKEFQRGLEAMARRDLAQAAKHFRSVVASDPLSFEAHNNLAVIYSEQGKEEDALAEVHRALELRPEYYRGRKNLAELYARLANRAFLDAAEIAPSDQREALIERAKRLARANGVSEHETPSQAPPPKAVAQAAPASRPRAAVAAVATRHLLSLGKQGNAALEIRPDSVSLYRQKGGEVQLVASYPVETSNQMPPLRALYVATSDTDGISLDPVDESEPALRLGSTSSAAAQIRLKEEHLKQIIAAVEPYLTPVLLLPEPAAVDPARVRSEISAAFDHWHASWTNKDLNGYIASYTDNYDSSGSGHAAWVAGRERIFARSGNISVEHSAPLILRLDGSVVTLAEQTYRSALLESSGVKLLSWVPTPAGWRIVEERMLTERPAPAR